MRIAQAQTLTFEYSLFRKTSIVLVKRLSRTIQAFEGIIVVVDKLIDDNSNC